VSLPYVISILVTSGDPDGVRVIEKSNWTGRGVMFARADLAAAVEQGLDSPGIYMLLGDDPDEQYDRQIYVGQGDNIAKRLQQHQRDDSKDFWDTTLVFLSGNQSLNRAHVSFLEAELIRLANSANRARLANGNQPSIPHLPPTDHEVAAGFVGRCDDSHRWPRQRTSRMARRRRGHAQGSPDRRRRVRDEHDLTRLRARGLGRPQAGAWALPATWSNAIAGNQREALSPRPVDQLNTKLCESRSRDQA